MPPRERFESDFVRPRPGRTLIVGSRIYGSKDDRRARFSDAVGIDMQPGAGVDIVADLEEPLPDLGRFDHIECQSVLEHSRRPWLLAANLETLLVSRGTLHLSVPFVWRFHGYPNDYWRYTAEGVRSLFHSIEWAQLMYCSNKLRPDHYLNGIEVDGFQHFPRCEVLGFGVRR